MVHISILSGRTMDHVDTLCSVFFNYIILLHIGVWSRRCNCVNTSDVSQFVLEYCAFLLTAEK
jgi:hypothetical protein